MSVEAKNQACFANCFGFGAMLVGIWLAALSGCADIPEHPGGGHASSALRLAIDESDSGPAGAVCGDHVLSESEECDPSVEGWKYLCDETCKRRAYRPCDSSVNDCGGNNALCASYVAEPGAQFCADFCRSDATCPVLPGFIAACNLAWCAVLCNEAGECPNGMSCVSGMTFLDFEGKTRGSRDVCVVTGAPVPRDAGAGF